MAAWDGDGLVVREGEGGWFSGARGEGGGRLDSSKRYCTA